MDFLTTDSNGIAVVFQSFELFFGLIQWCQSMLKRNELASWLELCPDLNLVVTSCLVSKNRWTRLASSASEEGLKSVDVDSDDFLLLFSFRSSSESAGAALLVSVWICCKINRFQLWISRPRFPWRRATSAEPAPFVRTRRKAVACGDTRKLRRKFDAGAYQACNKQIKWKSIGRIVSPSWSSFLIVKEMKEES